MKRFTLSTLIVAAALLLSSVSAAAQSFMDDTFIRLGAGVNMMYDNKKANAGGVAVDFSAGKWVIDQLAVRVGYHGVTDKAVDPTNWVYGSDSFGFHYVHADLVWDMVSTFNSDKAKDDVSVGPFIQAGAVITSKNVTKTAFGLGGGAALEYRVSDRVSLSCELAAILANEKVWRTSGRFTFFPSATVGAIFWL